VDVRDLGEAQHAKVWQAMELQELPDFELFVELVLDVHLWKSWNLSDQWTCWIVRSADNSSVDEKSKCCNSRKNIKRAR